jgi:hypothetical protein
MAPKCHAIQCNASYALAKFHVSHLRLICLLISHTTNDYEQAARTTAGGRIILLSTSSATTFEGREDTHGGGTTFSVIFSSVSDSLSLSDVVGATGTIEPAELGAYRRTQTIGDGRIMSGIEGGKIGNRYFGVPRAKD